MQQAALVVQPSAGEFCANYQGLRYARLALATLVQPPGGSEEGRRGETTPHQSRKVLDLPRLRPLAEEFKLGRKVCNLFADNGRKIINHVKPIITKHATDGVFRNSWKNLTSTQQAALVGLVHDVEPRLVEYFEGSWATDWVLKKLIDQRVADVKRVEGAGQNESVRLGSKSALKI